MRMMIMVLVVLMAMIPVVFVVVLAILLPMLMIVLLEITAAPPSSIISVKSNGDPISLVYSVDSLLYVLCRGYREVQPCIG